MRQLHMAVASIALLQVLACSNEVVDVDAHEESDAAVELVDAAFAADTFEVDASADPDAGFVEDAGPDSGLDSGSIELDAGQAQDAAVEAGTAADPSVRGPFTVTRQTTTTSGARARSVDIYLPSGTEEHPLIVFAPGFLIPTAAYRVSLEYLASHGFVVIAVTPASAGLFGPDHISNAADLRAVIDWALAERERTGSSLNGRVRPSGVGAFGHSLGGKLVTMAAALDQRITALFGADPVDGDGSPLPSSSRPDVVPSMVGSITAAVGFLGETGNGAGAFACAPSAQNFEQFYAGIMAASWAAKWRAIDADHVDFVAEPGMCGTACAFCTPGAADPQAVLSAMHTLSAAFFRRHLQNDVAADAWLTGGSVHSGVETESRN